MNDNVIRQHDTVLAEGAFRLAMTKQRRIVALIHAKTVIGPIRVMVEIQRPQHLQQRVQQMQVAGLFDGIARTISRAAENTFNAAAKVATTVARPVFNLAKQAAAQGAKAIANYTPLLPSNTRRQIEAASRVMVRARLGDVTAKDFVRSIASAAKSGVEGASKIAGHLMQGANLLAKATPVGLATHLATDLTSKIPGIGKVLASVSPTARLDRMIDTLKRGNINELKRLANEELSMAQGALSMVPGVGTGISSAVSAGLAALNGGKPLEIAIRAAYGAIPIPPGIRSMTDAALASVLALMNGGAITDVAVAAARERVPGGLPRDVFDTLIRIVVKRMPIQKAGIALAEHYVNHYGGRIANQYGGQVLNQLSPLVQQGTRFVQPVTSIASQAARFVQPAARVAQQASSILRPFRVGEEIGDGEIVGADDIDGADRELVISGYEEVGYEEVGAMPPLAEDLAILGGR